MSDITVNFVGPSTGIALGAATRAEAAQAAAEAALVDAEAAAAGAGLSAAAAARTNLWPDAPGFPLSGNDLGASAGGAPLYSSLYNSATWDPDFQHPYGLGAWEHAASTDIFGPLFELSHPTMEAAGIAVGSVVSFGFLIQGTATKHAIQAMRFYAGAPGSWVGSQVGTTTTTMDGSVQLVAINNVTWPATATGAIGFNYGESPLGAYHIIAAWAVQGTNAGAPPAAMSDYILAQRTAGDAITAPVPYSGLGWLRRVRAKANGLKQSTAVAAQIHIGLAGDSWFTTSVYAITRLSDELRQVYGDAGVGWFGLGWKDGGGGVKDYPGDARGLYYATYTGSWTANYHAGSTSPNISDARSSSAGAKITVASISGATHPALSAVKLHFTGTSNGVIKWRWTNAGSVGSFSGNTNLQGGVGVQQTLSLTGFPTGALSGAALDAIKLEVEVVSGSVIIGGVDFQSAANGVVIHKLGASGAKASDWETSAGTQWNAGIAALNLDAFGFMIGTNDQANGDDPSAIRTSVDAVLTSAGTAIPHVDKLLIAPPENQEGEATAMSLIAAALEGAAGDVGAAYLDLQPAFGDDPDEYGDGGLGLLLPASPHPTIAGSVCGAAVIASELKRTLFDR